jgi:hypothetical protein
VSLVSENVLRAADVLLVPLIPATLSLRTYAQLTRFVADAPRPRPEIVATFSMADRRKRLHREVIDATPRDGPVHSRGPTTRSGRRAATPRARVSMFTLGTRLETLQIAVQLVVPSESPIRRMIDLCGMSGTIPIASN